MAITESGEMYLETIYILSQKKPSVLSVDISREMGYSKPSVSRAIALLKKQGFLTVDPSGKVSLTPEGEKTAKNIYERHKVLSEGLMSLGVSREAAIRDACRVEHYISEETFQSIKRHLLERH